METTKWLKPLVYETKPEQLRYVLAKPREMFFAHPKIDPDTLRIRFIGSSSCAFGSRKLVVSKPLANQPSTYVRRSQAWRVSPCDITSLRSDLVAGNP